MTAQMRAGGGNPNAKTKKPAVAGPFAGERNVRFARGAGVRRGAGARPAGESCTHSNTESRGRACHDAGGFSRDRRVRRSGRRRRREAGRPRTRGRCEKQRRGDGGQATSAARDASEDGGSYRADSPPVARKEVDAARGGRARARQAGPRRLADTALGGHDAWRTRRLADSWCFPEPSRRLGCQRRTTSTEVPSE